METKSNLSLALSFGLMAIASICAGCSQGVLLSVRGQAILESGQPIENGVIVISELQGRPLSMPSLAKTVQTKTNSAGNFAAELTYEGGDVNISLDAAPCKWSLAFVKLKAEDLKDVRAVTPKLIAKPAVGSSCKE
jgi:hypothetical protein